MGRLELRTDRRRGLFGDHELQQVSVSISRPESTNAPAHERFYLLLVVECSQTMAMTAFALIA